MPTNHFRIERYDFVVWPVATKLFNTARIRVFGTDAEDNQASVTFAFLIDKAKILPPPKLDISGGLIHVPQSTYTLMRDLLRWEEELYCYYSYRAAELNAWLSTVEDDFPTIEGPSAGKQY